MVCAMCEVEIKTSKPILTFSDTLFQPSGRWIEHINVDNLCSMDCMKTLLQDEDGKWLCNTGAISCEDGAECSVCKNKFDAGHIVSLGWKKTKKERWHKIVTTRNYCGYKCMTTDLDDKKSPLYTNLPKKPTKKRKPKKKTTKKTTKKKAKKNNLK